jgi:hypothetical protein
VLPQIQCHAFRRTELPLCHYCPRTSLKVDAFTCREDLSTNQVRTIAAFGSSFGDSVPRRLLPLLRPFAKSTSLVIAFLEVAFTSPHWTEPGLLRESGTQIIGSAINNMRFNDRRIWNSPANEILTTELKTLIRCLIVTHGIPRRELETQYQIVLDKMVGSDLLDPDAVKECSRIASMRLWITGGRRGRHLLRAVLSCGSGELNTSAT